MNLLSCTEKVGEIPYFNGPDFTPQFLSNKDAQQLITHKIGTFSFVDQDSIIISNNDVQNKIHIANFIFTTCGSICPKMTYNMKSVFQEFQNDSNLIILSYSVTPWIDSIPQLKKFQKEYEIPTGNWHFLTGNTEAIYTLARQSYFAEEEIGMSKDSTEFLHTEHFILVDANQKIRGIYNGTLPFQINQLIKDVYTLKASK